MSWCTELLYSIRCYHRQLVKIKLHHNSSCRIKNHPIPSHSSPYQSRHWSSSSLPLCDMKNSPVPPSSLSTNPPSRTIPLPLGPEGIYNKHPPYISGTLKDHLGRKGRGGGKKEGRRKRGTRISIHLARFISPPSSPKWCQKRASFPLLLSLSIAANTIHSPFYCGQLAVTSFPLRWNTRVDPPRSATPPFASSQ